MDRKMEDSFVDAIGTTLGETLQIPKTTSLRFAGLPYNIGGSGVKMVRTLLEIQKNREKPPAPVIDPTIEGFPTFANQSRGMMTASLVRQIAKDNIFNQ
jgi:hypothetical protein